MDNFFKRLGACGDDSGVPLHELTLFNCYRREKALVKFHNHPYPEPEPEPEPEPRRKLGYDTIMPIQTTVKI